MKIVCDSCGAKYSIADEKVAGKVFKIRCKKCSAVIVVKGDNQEEGDEATRVYDYGAEAVWHVVVGGDQQGPLAPRQLGEMLAEGKIDWEAYVWREGMDGWQPAKDVETLVSAIMADAEGAPSPQAAAPQASQGQMFGGSSDMGADPFASSDDGGLSGVMGQSASAASSGGGADLFARSARSPFAGSADDDEPMSNGHHGGSSPHVSQAESMTGQRNENSVLFSLSNLQALATGSGGPPVASPKAKAGMAQGEGSGLIDIRALASATQSVSHGSSNGSSRDKVEDLMSVGAAGTGFSAAALAAPVAVEKSDNSKLMMGGMFGAILLLGAAVGYLVLRAPPAADPMAQTAVAGQPALGATLPTAAAAAVAPPPSGAAAAAAPELAAAAAPARGSEDESGTKEEKAERERTRAKRSGGGDAPAAAKSEKASAPEPAAAPAPAKQSSGDSSIDDLLGAALGGKAKPKAAAPAPSENLAPTPSRDEVMSAMKGVTPKVTACGDGSGGVAKAKVTVAGATGRVTSVEVDGPSQSCVTKEVSKAKFPKFANSSFSFTYPFKL
jgi:predicted Zn finger-like uncharacterized protein